MTPYAHLAQHYDALFRLNPALVAFVERTLDGLAGKRIVDAGCGTGTLALELSRRGARVLGVDLDEALFAQAAVKAAGAPLFEVLQGDLRSFPCEPGLDAVLCLGNTLPHLPSENDVAIFFRHARSLLRPGGALMLQLVNYDRILDQGITALPLLETPDLRFKRSYDPLPDGRLRFTTRLESTEDGVVTESEQALLPLRSAVVAGLMLEAGFASVNLLGGFDGDAFTTGSLALVLVGSDSASGQS